MRTCAASAAANSSSVQPPSGPMASEIRTGGGTAEAVAALRFQHCSQRWIAGSLREQNSDGAFVRREGLRAAAPGRAAAAGAGSAPAARIRRVFSSSGRRAWAQPRAAPSRSARPPAAQSCRRPAPWPFRAPTRSDRTSPRRSAASPPGAARRAAIGSTTVKSTVSRVDALDARQAERVGRRSARRAVRVRRAGRAPSGARPHLPCRSPCRR